MLIQNATAELHAARRLNEERRAERLRLRHVVEDIDRVIEACEQSHLRRVKQITPELGAQADRAIDAARAALMEVEAPEALRVVEGVRSRPRRRVTELMDGLWTIQEATFDVMLPWRNHLPEDVEEREPAAPWWRRAA